MLDRKYLTRLLHALLALIGSNMLFLVSVLTLRLGYLAMTADLIAKLIITWTYTWRFTGRQNWISTSADNGLQLDTNSSPPKESKTVIATVVGWREDQALYRKCLHSLAQDLKSSIVVGGIDGNTLEDEPMVDTFLEVFPDAVVLRLPDRVSQRLEKYVLELPSTTDGTKDMSRNPMEYLIPWARGVLIENLCPQSIENVKAICIVQPHHSKKDILMAALTFTIAIAEELGIEYLFSTDSDSEICPGALRQIADGLGRDPNIGGVSGHLRFFNPEPTFLSRMTTSHYWYEQQIAKCQGAMFGATECQPGPCAGFRVSALKSILVQWYMQTFCGHRMIVNEDRHLTTRLLWAGYSVHYVPDAIVYTETPSKFQGWIKQQVRWSRGTMIETLWYPLMLGRLSFWHIYNIIKARVIPIISFWCIAGYAFGWQDGWICNTAWLMDAFCTLAVQAIFAIHLGPDITNPLDIIWLIPSIVWFFVMSPGIVVWSLLTIFDDSWGNSPRAIQPVGPNRVAAEGGNKAQDGRVAAWKYVGFQTVWLSIVVAAGTRLISENL